MLGGLVIRLWPRRGVAAATAAATAVDLAAALDVIWRTDVFFESADLRLV